MPYAKTDELPAEVRNKLDPAQQEAFMAAFNAAMEQGKTEEEAFKIAWSAAQKVSAAEARTLRHYKVLSPGVYSPSPAKIAITAADVKDFVDAVNIKAGLGVPVAIKYDHRDGLGSIAVGKMLSAILEGEDAYADIEISMDAEYDGIRIASVGQICDGLEKQILQGSMEAYRKYQSEAYTGDRTFSLWPTAWAVLPAGDQPAVPPKMIAIGESGISLVRITGAPMRGGESPTERGHEMTLEEALKVIAELKAELAELKKSKAEDSTKEELDAKDKEITDLQAKVAVFEKAEADAVEAKAVALEKTVLDTKVLAGKRDEVKDKLKGMDSHQKVQFLEVLDATLAPIKAGEGSTTTGDDPGDGEASPREKVIAKQKAAINEAADKNKLNLAVLQDNEQATRIAMRDHPELFTE